MFLPPGSFISVQDFLSVKALTEYLVCLDKNDTAYGEYFAWKPEVAYAGMLGLKDTVCDICDALHNEYLKPQFYKDISSLFGTAILIAKIKRIDF